MVARIQIPEAKVADFCRRNHIRKLALFGSVLRDDFGPESDVDVLVEFEPGKTPGLAFGSMGEELSSHFAGRYIDLKTPGCFRPEMLEKVLGEALLLYGTPFRRPRSDAAHAGGGRRRAPPRQGKKTR